MTLHTLAKCNVMTFRTGSVRFNFLSVQLRNCIIFREIASFIHLQNKHKPKHLEKREQSVKRMEKLVENGWIKTKYFDIFPWSISGVESCVVVRNPEVAVVFDMGYALPESVRCSTVLISHGHMDHTAGIIPHASKRSLCGMSKASYYMPHHMVDPLQKISQLFNTIHDPSGQEDVCPMQLHGVGPDETIKINSQWFARPFPTLHRVQSQGYILYKNQKKLKPEYQGLPSQEIGQLVRGGQDIHDHTETPILAYTGDTTFDLFLNPPSEDLLKVDTLVTEATYIDGGAESMKKAYDRGHAHILQFAENEQLFDSVGNIVFVHFSDKYSSGYIQRTCAHILPSSFYDKVHLGHQCKILSESIQHKK